MGPPPRLEGPSRRTAPGSRGKLPILSSMVPPRSGTLPSPREPPRLNAWTASGRLMPSPCSDVKATSMNFAAIARIVSAIGRPVLLALALFYPFAESPLLIHRALVGRWILMKGDRAGNARRSFGSTFDRRILVRSGVRSCNRDSLRVVARFVFAPPCRSPYTDQRLHSFAEVDAPS